MSSRPFHAFLNWRRQRKPLVSRRSTLQFETLEPRLLLNAAPVAMIDDHSLHSNEWSQVASWIYYSDAANNAATQYQFWDGGDGANSGYFWTPDNAHQPANTAITLQPPTSTMSGFAAARPPAPRPCRCAPSTAPTGAPGIHSRSRRSPTPRRSRPSTTTACTPTNGRRSRTGLPTLTPTDNAATQYQFWDGGTGADSGYFWTPDNAHHAGRHGHRRCGLRPRQCLGSRRSDRRLRDHVGARLRRHRLERLGSIHAHDAPNTPAGRDDRRPQPACQRMVAGQRAG